MGRKKGGFRLDPSGSEFSELSGAAECDPTHFEETRTTGTG
jgi:hypothetical protein